MLYYAFLILGTVITIVWWASMWAKNADDGDPPVDDAGYPGDEWPPPPKR